MFKGLRNKLATRIVIGALAAGAVFGGATTAEVATAPSSEAYTKTQDNRWVYLNGSWQCWHGYLINYSFWEETTLGKRDYWYRVYQVNTAWCSYH